MSTNLPSAPRTPREHQLEGALQEIMRAVAIPGPNPQHHAAIREAHRRQWPTLWNAIDRARAALMTAPSPALRPAAPMVGVDQEALRTAIGAVLFNVSNYPAPVQAAMLGQSHAQLTEKILNAVIATLPPDALTDAQGASQTGGQA